MHLLARAQRLHMQRERRERHRAQQFHGEPSKEVGGARIVLLTRMSEQRGGRAAVQGIRIPRTARQLGRTIQIAIAHEERAVLHDRIVSHDGIVR